MKYLTLSFALAAALLASCGGGSSANSSAAQPSIPKAQSLAAAAPAPSCGYPSWSAKTKYIYSAIAYSDGQLYWARHDSINQVPAVSPKNWWPYTCTTAPVGSCDAYLQWNSTKRYLPGDRVNRLGKTYEALPISATVWNVNSPPEGGPNYWGEVQCTDVVVAPAPAPAPTAPAVTLGNYPDTLLEVGNTWMEDGVWGAVGLTRGTYTGLTGTQYEQYIGVSPQLGSNGEVAGRVSWKFPTGTTEVKSYSSFITGAKPGWYNSWILPGGFAVQKTDGSQVQIYPSGATPSSPFPLQLSSMPTVSSSFAYQHNSAPTGRGHLTYDIWLQNTPTQCHGFDNCQEITHEIMIPLDYWGGYGQYKAGGGGRNPSWYIKDVVIDGRLFHLFAAQNADGTLTASFGAGWKFIVFEPDQPIAPGTLNLSSFMQFIQQMKDSAGTPWATGNEWLVSVELGVEAVDGTGDLTLFNYRVWK